MHAPCEDPVGPSLRAMKHFLRMWLHCRALHGRRLLATTREGGNLCASAPRDPGARCTDAAGCPEPHLRSARLPLADHLASNGSSRLVRSPGTHLASTEPSRSFARAHLLSIMTPHVHQPYGRFTNGNELCVRLTAGAVGIPNLDDEEWARASFFSAPRVGFFDILFVGGHEAVCAVTVEPPPPIPRARSRPLHVSDACAHVSAGDSHASGVVCGRGCRALRVQGHWVGWVDDAGRASGRLRPHPPRRHRLESPRLHDACGGRRRAAAAADRPVRSPGPLAGCGTSTTCTARAVGGLAAGARPAVAALAPSAAASSASPTLAACV